MKSRITVTLIVLLFCFCCTAALAEDIVRPEPSTAGLCLDSLTTGMNWEYAKSSDTRTYGQYNQFCFSSNEITGKLTIEYWSDGYDRYTLYGGPKCGSTMAAVRWDDCDRVWAGINHVQRLGKKLALILRPLVGTNTKTEDRLYLIADYSGNNKLGITAFFLGVKDNCKTEDTYIGPTYHNGRTNYWLAKNVTNGGTYVDVSYSIPLK